MGSQLQIVAAGQRNIGDLLCDDWGRSPSSRRTGIAEKAEK
jgi:hypothetical protein